MSINLELKHLSASTINTFIENRPKWFAQKFCGMKFSGSIHTARGHAVEAGIVKWLECGDMTEAVKAAMEEWDDKITGMEDNLEFRQSIAPLIKVGVEGTDDHEGFAELKTQFGKAKTQEKIEVWLDGCDIPIIGYLDFLYGKRVVDNKVTGRSPSSLSQGYILQGSIYRKATGLPVYFLFEVANKKPTVKIFKLTDEEYESGLNLATQAARAIQYILDSPIDGALMKAFMFPDPAAGFGDEQKTVIESLGYKL